MKTAKYVSLVLILIILITALRFSFGAVEVKPDIFNEIVPLLGVLFVVALFIERAIEVFLSTLRSAEADIQDNNLNVVKTKIETRVKENQLEKIEELEDVYNNLQIRRTQYRIESRMIALWAGLILGIIVSAAGIRVLNQLFIPVTVGTQAYFFTLADIVLTGCVLAGGSEGINKITKIYSAYMDRAKENAKVK